MYGIENCTCSRGFTSPSSDRPNHRTLYIRLNDTPKHEPGHAQVRRQRWVNIGLVCTNCRAIQLEQTIPNPTVY